MAVTLVLSGWTVTYDRFRSSTSGGPVNNAYFNSGVFKAPVAGQFLIERGID